MNNEEKTCNHYKTKISDFTFVEDEKSLERFASTDIVREEGIEIIPSIYATAISSGILTYETYRFFADKIIGKLKEAKEIDGIWLHLHGSMEVEDVGSGELALLDRKSTRLNSSHVAISYAVFCLKKKK